MLIINYGEKDHCFLHILYSHGILITGAYHAVA